MSQFKKTKLASGVVPCETLTMEEVVILQLLWRNSGKENM